MNDPVYDEVAAFLAELAGGGVRHVVLSPGSRSTPLAVCAAAQPALSHWVQVDERSAGFFALGLAKASRSPVVLVCTSGTAAANYFPAVIEASRTGVPLVVLSADRPPDMHGGWGANQTIDQTALFGSYSRLFVEMPVGGTSTEEVARETAQDVLSAIGSPQVGPAHVNWPFRKPLEPLGDVPSPSPVERPVVMTSEDCAAARLRLQEVGSAKRGAIVVGPLDDPDWVGALTSFATARGWPILAEATSQLRLGRSCEEVIHHSDRLLRVEALRTTLVPDVVLFAGATPTGPGFIQWMQEHQVSGTLLVDPAAPWNDTGSVNVEVLTLDAASVLTADAESANDDRLWLQNWQALDRLAAARIDEITDETLLGPGVIRGVVEALLDGSQLMIANSMSIRDLDRYAAGRSGVRVHSSRGASGVDGLVATAAGISAAAVGPVTLIIGDIALLHDVGSVLAAARLELDLTIVVVNDDGGGIFSMLPISDHGDKVDFDELFHTPHGTNFSLLGNLDGVDAVRVSSREQLRDALSQTVGGVSLIEVAVDHEQNLAQRQAIDDALEQAVA